MPSSSLRRNLQQLLYLLLGLEVIASLGFCYLVVVVGCPDLSCGYSSGEGPGGLDDLAWRH